MTKRGLYGLHVAERSRRERRMRMPQITVMRNKRKSRMARGLGDRRPPVAHPEERDTCRPGPANASIENFESFLGQPDTTLLASLRRVIGDSQKRRGRRGLIGRFDPFRAQPAEFRTTQSGEQDENEFIADLFRKSPQKSNERLARNETAAPRRVHR